MVDYNEDVIRQFIGLKSENPNVKLLIGIGGPNWGAQWPSTIAASAATRVLFSNNVKSFIDKFNFDGCDFAWEKPGQGIGSSTVDKDNYLRILESLRTALGQNKILSISVAPRQEDIDSGYNIPKIIIDVDFINLNTYNLRGYQGETVTGFHSPYRRDSTDQSSESEWNTESIVKNWLSKGCPAEKLTLGIPTYGRSFTLSNINLFSIGAPVDGIGTESEYLNDNNVIPYTEICYNVQANPKWLGLFNTQQYAAYAVFNANQWVGYDDLNVARAKIHLALDHGLGGLNYASIDKDDFIGQCGGPKFPLVKMGYDAIVNNIVPENQLEQTTTPRTTQPPTTTPEVTTPKETPTPGTKDPDREIPPTTEKITTKKITTEKPTTVKIPTPPMTVATTRTTSDPNNLETEKSTVASTVIESTTEKLTTVPKPETPTTKTTTTTKPTTTTKLTTTTTKMTTTSKKPVTVPDENGTFKCPAREGSYKDPNNCNKFFMCAHFVAYSMNCQPGLVFNESENKCDYSSNVIC